MMKKREYGIDLIKIIASVIVVAAHTLVITDRPLHRVVVFHASLAMPMFCMVSGYLMMRRSVLDYRYALRKIATILAVCFAWEALHAVAHFAVYRELREFWVSFVLDFFQKGLFYHFWYMGALILVYLYMPLVDKLYRRSEKGYLAVLLILGLVNTGLDAAAILTKSHAVEVLPQSLRIHFWYFYAMLGGWIARNPQAVSNLANKLRLWHIGAAIAVFWSYMYATSYHVYNAVKIEASNGALIVQLTAFVLFVYSLKLTFSAKAERCIGFLGSLTMGIYIMHPFVLAVLNKFIPAFTQGSGAMNLLFWIATTVVSAIGTIVVLKFPVLNRLLKL